MRDWADVIEALIDFFLIQRFVWPLFKHIKKIGQYSTEHKESRVATNNSSWFIQFLLVL